MDCYGVSDPPNGPIQFNSRDWVKNSGIRKPTSAHELFHKIQYAYGYKTRWNPQKPYLWFTEGTAAWAEVFVWGMVSRNAKADTIFRDTGLGLYQADYAAMPFWIYCVQGNHQTQNNEFMVRLLEKCEQLRGDIKLALDEVIKENYGSVGDFFKSFAKDRKCGFWPIPVKARTVAFLDPTARTWSKRSETCRKSLRADRRADIGEGGPEPPGPLVSVLRPGMDRSGLGLIFLILNT